MPTVRGPGQKTRGAALLITLVILSVPSAVSRPLLPASTVVSGPSNRSGKGQVLGRDFLGESRRPPWMHADRKKWMMSSRAALVRRIGCLTK